MSMELEPGIHRIFVGRGDSPGQYAPNTYVLVGQEGAALVDTGYDRDEEVQARLALLKELGNPHVTAIILTHRHLDHVGGAVALHQATGAPILAHPGEREHIQRGGQGVRGVPVDRVVQDGERMDLGGLTAQFVHTPGHTLGCLSVFVPERRALFTGDMVLGLGTTVISPDEGDLTLYLDSLRKMLTYDPVVLYPGHGPVIRNAKAKLLGLLEHRMERERQIVALLEQGPQTVDRLLSAIYPELHEHLHNTARRQIRSHLLKLEKEKRAHATGSDTFALV